MLPNLILYSKRNNPFFFSPGRIDKCCIRIYRGRAGSRVHAANSKNQSTHRIKEPGVEISLKCPLKALVRLEWQCISKLFAGLSYYPCRRLAASSLLKSKMQISPCRRRSNEIARCGAARTPAFVSTRTKATQSNPGERDRFVETFLC